MRRGGTKRKKMRIMGRVKIGAGSSEKRVLNADLDEYFVLRKTEI
jgi:hypothetical protein